MPYVDFPALQRRPPTAFKRYVYWLPRAEGTGTDTWSLPLNPIGRERGRHVPPAGRYPATQHGVEGTVRRALDPLIAPGFLEKTGQRGRCPNTYQLVKTPEQIPQTDTAHPCEERR